MPLQILMKREGFKLVPWDAMAEDDMLSLHDAGPIMVSITKKRSVPFHRLYFACLGSMAKAGAPGSSDDLHIATKLKTGLVNICQMPNGEYIAFADSISFNEMDQHAFNAWFPKAVEFWKSSGLWNWIAPDLRDKLEDGQREAA